MCCSSETPPTFFTQMWTFTCMNEAMNLKVTKLCETLPTFIAYMWTFSCVYPVVNCQIEIITKTFVAYFTDVQTITGSTVGSISENRLEVWSENRTQATLYKPI